MGNYSVTREIRWISRKPGAKICVFQHILCASVRKNGSD